MHKSNFLKLGNLGKILKSKATIGESPYIEIGDISISEKTYEFKNKASIKGAIYAIKDSILISKVRPTRGAISIVNEDKIAVSNAFFVIYPEKILPKLLFYFLAYNSGFLSYLGSKSKGTLYPSCKEKDIVDYNIPVPPAEIQHLIVSEIEKQFSRLDEGLSSLVRIRENLKSYRASLLKSAVEGRLTAEWRAEHPDIESADILLDRIRIARREKWLSENPGKKYKEIDELVDGIKEIEIPNKWKWTQLGEIIYDGPQNGIYKPATAYGEGISILRIDDYQNTYIKNKEELRLLKLSDNEIKLYGLDECDLVINRVNSMTHLGKSVIIPKTILPCVFESNMMRIKLSPHLSIKYIEFYLHSYIGIKQLQKNAKQAVNQASINQQDVKSVMVPFPPLLEQNRIVEVLEEKFSVIDSLESLVDANIKRAENLKQAILKKAFSGELITE